MVYLSSSPQQLWDNLGMHHFSSEAPLLASSRAVLCALIKSTCRQTLFYDTFGADESQSFEVTVGSI